LVQKQSYKPGSVIMSDQPGEEQGASVSGSEGSASEPECSGDEQFRPYCLSPKVSPGYGTHQRPVAGGAEVPMVLCTRIAILLNKTERIFC